MMAKSTPFLKVPTHLMLLEFYIYTYLKYEYINENSITFAKNFFSTWLLKFASNPPVILHNSKVFF